MADLKTLFHSLDQLAPDDLEKVRAYIEERQRTTWWVVKREHLDEIAEIMRPVQDEAARMTEDEIDSVIDEALDEVRRERKADSGRD